MRQRSEEFVLHVADKSSYKHHIKCGVEKLTLSIASPSFFIPQSAPPCIPSIHPRPKMTINHVFLYVTASKLPTLRSFYRTILEPLGYTEMIRAHDETLIGYGSDYPYLWLRALPPDQKPMPTHIAIDAPDFAAVDEFHTKAL